VIRAALAALALVFAVAHLPFLVSSLEDIDSVNFALGVRDFDVARHRPHPPGYPIYIAMGKIGASIVGAVTGEAGPSTIEARTLSGLSLAGALAAIVLLYRVLTAAYGRHDSTASSADLAPPWRVLDARALATTGLVAACPLFWYLAVRPMSDVPGLAAALAAQAALGLAWWRQRGDGSGDRRLSPEQMAASGAMIVAGSLLAGVAIGFRSQNAVLTVPLLAGVLVDRIGRGVAGALVGSMVAFTAGSLLWAVPLVVASGGLDAYMAALGTQAGEDFAGVEMLYLNPSPRLIALAVVRTFVDPWDSVALGSIVLVLAALGLGSLAWRERRALAAVLLTAGPYLVFHLLFQDTTFVRYALPLIPAVAFLAVCALEMLPRRAVLPVAGVLAVWGVTIASPTLATYAAEPSPTVRAVAAMESARSAGAPGALGMHQTFVRPLEAERLTIEPRLPSPPRREWRELVRYWREGHTAPLWFLADPRRSDLALLDPKSRADRTDFSWRFASRSNLGGMRPDGVHWYRLAPPGWFADEGWALTPETAGIARLIGRGPSLAPITAWLRRRDEPMRVLIGGRHLGAATDPPARFQVAIDGRHVAEWQSAAGFFVQQLDLPAGLLAGDGALAELTVESHPVGTGQAVTAIEQFDAQIRGSLMWVFDEGWHEAEYSPMLGVWRWTSERATLRIVDASGPVAVTFRIERPRRYYDDDPQVRLMAGERIVSETAVSGELLSVVVPLEALQASNGRLTIETNRTFVPAEQGRDQDRRRLGLRVFGVNVAAQP
jgi:hypothetical protein